MDERKLGETKINSDGGAETISTWDNQARVKLAYWQARRIVLWASELANDSKRELDLLPGNCQSELEESLNK